MKTKAWMGIGSWTPMLRWMCCAGLAVGLAVSARAEGVDPVPGAPVFEEIPGSREFSGSMIARPVQREAAIQDGHSRKEAKRLDQTARNAMTAYVVTRYVPQTDEYVFDVPAGSSESAVAAALMATGAFQYVEPDWILYPIACPNDPGLGSQWHHNANRMNSCAGWDVHTGNPTVSVGICDTGVLTTHEDLQLHRLEGYNAVDQLWESQGGQIGPVHSHGTQTTGCAAANGNNAKGVSGVGWDLSHRMLRVSNSSGGSSSQSILQHAARTAVENGDRVASVSYSGVDSSSNLTTATYIKSIGGLLVWAAGNDNRNLTFSSRDSDDIIVAGATDSNDAKASFSAYGPMVDLVAPGVSVYTTTSSANNAYAAVSGTSFACPLTAGEVALIWSKNPALTPDQVEDVLKASCDDLGTGGIDNTFGYGRINTLKSMNNAGGGITDCNGNGIDDATDIANGTSQDCNGNARPDECDLADGTSSDCNGNGTPDECDISGGSSADCNNNNVPDECDISGGTSQDANGNGIPDECENPSLAGTWMAFESDTVIPVVGTAANEDVVSYNAGTGQWKLVFDGSDVGLSGFAIDGLAVLPGGDLLLSFTASGTVPGVGTADDSDIVRFTPTSLGANTSGTFSMYFDGSDVGLSTSDEDVDAISLDASGRLIISTVGAASMNGSSGQDEDLFTFNATSYGSNTAGTFSMLFDGSDVGLGSNSNEDVDAVCWTSAGKILLSTIGDFSVTGLSGADEDVFQFTPTSLGSNTAGSYTMTHDLSALGINTAADVKAAEVVN
ncbi:MAG: S8 family serine peptidase [Phycisphaerales bacterium]|nr:S8 family serine peptidase [Phycisphaerales bacterium]